MGGQGEQAEVTREEAIGWIRAGLTPRELEHEIRNGVAIDRIAVPHSATPADVSDLMDRWGLAHLSGRAKSGVGVVSKLGTKGRK